MKVVIVDAFCSSNRGDAAILQGIIDGLQARKEGLSIQVVSQFPSVGRLFHPEVEFLDARKPVAAAISKAQLVVGCGGSYLHDLYAQNLNSRLGTLALAARFEVPFVPFAQSFGPFFTGLSRIGVGEVLTEARWILARDAASVRELAALGVQAARGVDAALGLIPWQIPHNPSPRLGLTLRSWHFPKSLEPAQAQAQAQAQARAQAQAQAQARARARAQACYEQAVVAALQAWKQKTNGHIKIFSNCTALGGYAQEDRIPARRVASQCGAEVVEEELSFKELIQQIGGCDFFMGTRMHSLIFATMAGVPALGIAYEQKTVEWMRQVGGTSLPIEDCTGLTEQFLKAWEDREFLKEMLEKRAPMLRQAAAAQADALVGLIDGKAPAWTVAPGLEAIEELEKKEAGKEGWNLETWRYDRVHRRVRTMAAIVLGERASGRVLDLGCSTGMLGRLLGAQFAYTGVDSAPSVAVAEPRFRIETQDLDCWEPDTQVGVVLASGSLEYVADRVGILKKIRKSLSPSGLAVLSLFNLGHISRGPDASRHPTWKFTEYLDEFFLLLEEYGLAASIQFSSAGYMPSMPVDQEGLTDHMRDGGYQLAPSAILKLAHHGIFICRPTEPRPGLLAAETLVAAGQLEPALALLSSISQRCLWSPRLWSDIGALYWALGKFEQAESAWTRSFLLDPRRPSLQENLVETGFIPACSLSGLALYEHEFLLKTSPESQKKLAQALLEAGRLWGARAVLALPC